MDDVDVDETNMIPGLDAPVPSSGPSNTVVCSLRSLSMNTLVAFPDTYKLEIRFLRGKKIKICIQQSHDDTIPSRMEIRFDYHFIMELDIQPDDTGEVALMLDLCRIPKFFWLESSAGGRPKFVETSDVSSQCALSRGRRLKAVLNPKTDTAALITSIKAIFNTCPRLCRLLKAANPFPATLPSVLGPGSQYASNKADSCPAFGEMPVNGKPLDVDNQHMAILKPDRAFNFQCYKCGLRFTMEDVLGPDFDHWLYISQLCVNPSSHFETA